jgi:hypothetical protein
MPTNQQHAERVRQGLAFIATPLAQDHPNELVVSYFYTCLHMFECTVFDFNKKKQHFRTHGDRADFFIAICYDTRNPFFGVGSDYGALRRLSEQARYLSPASSETYEPIVPKRDVPQAKTLYECLKAKFEDIYKVGKKTAPWNTPAQAAATAPQSSSQPKTQHKSASGLNQ